MTKKKTNTFIIKRTELGCSQPYINRGKYVSLMNSALPTPALPVIDYQGHYYLTDGHTKALLSQESALSVYLDSDIQTDLLKQGYIKFIQWTKAAGVNCLDDLADRIVDAQVFEEIWVKHCQNYLQELQQKSLNNK